MDRPRSAVLLAALIACTTTPTTHDTSATDWGVPYEAPHEPHKAPESVGAPGPLGESQDVSSELSEATADPCGAPDMGGPWPALLGKDWTETNTDGLYEATERLTIFVEFCEEGGHIDVYDEDTIYGTANQGTSWAVHVLPDMTVEVSGGVKYELTTCWPCVAP